ncbi:MAG: branched-chain amino acid aminotransferase [Novosphingobium sp.]|nr:branched-chain amino acid aminotransferase [Novosphingobium sp.]
MLAATTFAHVPHPAPTADAVRAGLVADPGFGKIFSDHMVTIDWTEGQGWHSATLGPRQPIALDPAASVLHYAQEIFEGLKAYRLQLVAVDADWFPSVEGGSLYLRPFMIATEAFLGVRPAKEYKFIVIASPAGNYFKSGAPAVSIWVSDYTRAAPGGTGAAKCGGNYAASLVPTAEAFAKGHDQVLFLDAAEHKWIEELGGMNLFFVMADGRIVTPPLTGTILPGVTRDSLLQLAAEEGLKVAEEPYSLDQWQADAASGALLEAFACGTAAVVTSVGKVAGRDREFTIGSGGPGQLTQKLRSRLVSIQRGEAPDPHGWVMKL